MLPSQLSALSIQSNMALLSTFSYSLSPPPCGLLLFHHSTYHSLKLSHPCLHIMSSLIDCTLPKGHSLSLSLLQCQNLELRTAHSSYPIHTYKIKAIRYLNLCWACHIASRKKFNGFNQIRTIRAFKGRLEHTSHFMD